MATQETINLLSSIGAQRPTTTSALGSLSSQTQASGTQFVSRVAADVDMRGNTVINFQPLVSTVYSKQAVDSAYSASLREALVANALPVEATVEALAASHLDVGVIEPPDLPASFFEHESRPAIPNIETVSERKIRGDLSTKLPEISLRCHSIVSSLARVQDVLLYRELTR